MSMILLQAQTLFIYKIHTKYEICLLWIDGQFQKLEGTKAYLKTEFFKLNCGNTEITAPMSVLFFPSNKPYWRILFHCLQVFHIFSPGHTQQSTLLSMKGMRSLHLHCLGLMKSGEQTFGCMTLGLSVTPQLPCQAMYLHNLQPLLPCMINCLAQVFGDVSLFLPQRAGPCTISLFDYLNEF